MTHSELIKNLSQRIGKSKIETTRLIKISTDVLKKLLDDDKSIAVPGLGTFQALVKNERKSYDPYHKKLIQLPQKRIITFKPSSIIKKELKKERAEK